MPPETKAQVVDKLAEDEHTDASQFSVSKLRARSAALQAETDPRYKGKKILRKDLKKSDDVEYDPELAKYFAIESDEEDKEESEDEEDSEDEEESEDDEDTEDEEEEYDKETGGEELTVESENESADERGYLLNKSKGKDKDDYSKGDGETMKKIPQMQNEPDSVT